jgi:hypothetical protein
VFLTQAVLPGAHASADAMALTLWLIVATLLACAVASTLMVRAQPAGSVAAAETMTEPA